MHYASMRSKKKGTKLTSIHVCVSTRTYFIKYLIIFYLFVVIFIINIIFRHIYGERSTRDV